MKCSRALKTLSKDYNDYMEAFPYINILTRLLG